MIAELSLELLEVITQRSAEILVGERIIDQLELPEQAHFKIRRNQPVPLITDKEGLKPSISK